jgi:hypothetical protein
MSWKDGPRTIVTLRTSIVGNERRQFFDFSMCVVGCW